MLPTLLLAAVVPCAIPGMDREATALEASELLRGHWRLVYREQRGRAEPLFLQTLEFVGRTLVQRSPAVQKAGVRVVPTGNFYALNVVFEDPETKIRARLDFRGREFRLLFSGPNGFVVSVWVRQYGPERGHDAP